MVAKLFYVTEGTKGAGGCEAEEAEGNTSIRNGETRHPYDCWLCAVDISCQPPLFSSSMKYSENYIVHKGLYE